MESKKQQYSQGCILGSFCGDSLGAYIQFLPKEKLNQQKMKETMKMEGGGIFKLKPGQVTDDSELALCMMNGIIKMVQNKRGFHLESIAQFYLTWLLSKPMDIGITTKNAFSITKINQQKYPQMVKNSQIHNQDSQSNGSLMRIAPLAVAYAYNKLKRDQIRRQIIITHSNQDAILAGELWVDALQQLINRKSDDDIKSILTDIQKKCQNTTLKAWMDESKQMMEAFQKMGWAKIAWSYGFYFLRKISNKQLAIDKQLYKKVMFEVLSKGGDTDTNACIVGGMIGAIVGIDKIQQDYKTKVQNATPRDNLDYLNVKNILKKYMKAMNMH